MWVVLNSKSSSWNPVERLIFPAPIASYHLSSYPDELILIPRADGEKVPCLFLPFRHARFLVIYFHANAEDLGLCYSFCKIMRDLFQVHVLAVEYPGYGICHGSTDEEGIMANAVAAMRFATEDLHWPCDGIKLFGRSLGTGPTVALATQYDIAGVILVSPFTSIRDLFRSQVGVFAEVVGDRFRNRELAGQISSPTLIVHGQQDSLIPLDHGKQVYESLTTRKMMVCPATMGHNTSLLKSIGTFVLPMTQFFSLPDYTFEDIEIPDWAFACPRPAAQRTPTPPQRAATTALEPSRARGAFEGAVHASLRPVPKIQGFSTLRPVGAWQPVGASQGVLPSREQAQPSPERNGEDPDGVFAAQRPKLSPRPRSQGPAVERNLYQNGFEVGPRPSRGYMGSTPKAQTARAASSGSRPGRNEATRAHPEGWRAPAVWVSPEVAQAPPSSPEVVLRTELEDTGQLLTASKLGDRDQGPWEAAAGTQGVAAVNI